MVVALEPLLLLRGHPEGAHRVGHLRAGQRRVNLFRQVGRADQDLDASAQALDVIRVLGLSRPAVEHVEQELGK